MSALRISRPGYPTQLIPVDEGITPRPISPHGWVRGDNVETLNPRHKFGTGNVEKALSLTGRNPDDEVVQAPSIEVPQ